MRTKKAEFRREARDTSGQGRADSIVAWRYVPYQRMAICGLAGGRRSMPDVAYLVTAGITGSAVQIQYAVWNMPGQRSRA
jgi:hypothetical protein